MTARYRSTSFRTRYASSRRRCPTSLSSPRREWLSFGKLRRCSVSDLIRSVRSAICTSGEPVSPSCVANSSTIALFASLASGTYSSTFVSVTLASLPERGLGRFRGPVPQRSIYREVRAPFGARSCALFPFDVSRDQRLGPGWGYVPSIYRFGGRQKGTQDALTRCSSR